MLFNTPEFFLFFILVLALYYLLPRQRLYTLAIANALFYLVGGAGYLVLFIIISLLSYLFSCRLQDTHRKTIFGLAILLNVANLLFFKYTLFILSNIEKIFSIHLISSSSFIVNLAMPIGISFYTFELIAYLVDVYTGKIEPAKSWLIFWTFVSFFPHRVSGPIMRGKDLIPSVENASNITWKENNFKLGMAYLAMGLVKKIIIADYLAGHVNHFYSDVGALSSIDAWIASYFYTFQIYFDFSAYSEMAVGIAYLLGIKLDLNFKTPYLSENPTEFWKRWHITLSSWIKDYIYIPLGGSRLGEARTYLNLFLAMTISGLWHGAAWTFVVWGIYHGILVILHKIFLKTVKYLGTPPGSSLLYKCLGVLITFHLVSVGWVFFRSGSIGDALTIIHKMLALHPSQINTAAIRAFAKVMGLYLIHILEYYVRLYHVKLSSYWERHFPAPVRALVYTVLIAILILWSKSEQSSFIYFKF